MCCSSDSSAAELAALHATTSSFAPAVEQMIGDLDREPLQLLLRAVAVREARGVAEVQVVLGRQRDEQLVQHGQAADARVEHGDRALLLTGIPMDGARARRGPRRVRSPRPMRALIVTNMYPTPDRPALGSFVRDQVQALRADRRDRARAVRVRARASRARTCGRARPCGALPRRALRRRPRPLRALTAWPALAVSGPRARRDAARDRSRHPRSRAITLAGLRTIDLVATVSEPLAREGSAVGVRRAARRAADRRRHRPLPTDPARAGPRRAGPRSRRPLPAVSGRSAAAGEAL